MKSSQKNFIIDIIAFVSFVFLVSTGVILYYILPPGSGRQRTIWQMDRHEWGDIHFCIALVFLAILALHLFMHWRWIRSLTKGKKRESSGYRVGLGLVGFIAVLAIALAPLLSPLENSGKTDIEGHENSEHESDIEKIGGSMTLQEIEQLTGVPAEYIIQKLQLPKYIPNEEKLGWLRKEYDFTIEEVRLVVEGYNDNSGNN
ncbi:MAG: DUF4405 domain-containing protein [Flavobacteriaceae bacterium]|nr:DUF4405 domain-containing protein [Flavobacteriaceae bacterium]